MPKGLGGIWEGLGGILEALGRLQAMLAELVPQWYSVVTTSRGRIARIRNTARFSDVLDVLRRSR